MKAFGAFVFCMIFCCCVLADAGVTMTDFHSETSEGAMGGLLELTIQEDDSITITDIRSETSKGSKGGLLEFKIKEVALSRSKLKGALS
jgi:hypothetical protein